MTFDELLDRIGALPAPAVIGIGGAVAVGKTTIAGVLAESLGADIVSTDAFLYPNALLAERDLVMRKGFPETYDASTMSSALAALKRGERVSIPVYSHATYDVLPGDAMDVGPCDLVILEGVVGLQSYVRPHLDLALYIDAPEELVRTWFVARFAELTAAARTDPSSFYAMFAGLDPEALLQTAGSVWDAINGVNLREHIAPTRAAADLVVTKGDDHVIVSIEAPA